MHRFASSHTPLRQGAGLSTLTAERASAARETRFSWALIVLLSLATITVALSATISPVSSEPSSLTAK
ncbi:hypothetical protein [Salinarimonas soli]|uniref:Uncharacterized protein n=1 Tax=Salinarimonas soli TaxID=1638099 RepID=A0A5B2VD86_9HYPH|nr:hypothetical protein [Salinarimonas soli]KAA2236725.1 hypothetical protein F0L46_13230 [Salinarimonas soli]